MKTTIHDLTQGTDAWHQFRLEHNGASEAAAMLGLSKNVTRTELIAAKATGIAKEFSDFVQTKVLDRGHEVEALARPIVEDILGEELFPATFSMGRLSASCDGLTIDGSTAFEHKQWERELANAVSRGELPDEHQPQCQQVMLVTNAERLIFVVSDGTRENMVHLEVRPNQAWIDRIYAGWAQFERDLANYRHVEVLPGPVAEVKMALPALSIQVNGQISLIDNLGVFGAKLTEFIDGIDRNPSTDQAFADTEAAIKTLEKAQVALEAAEASALAQTASIDEMRRTVAQYAGQARATRLMLEKLVKVRKDTIRIEIVQEGKAKFAEHILGLNKRLGKDYMPVVVADFAGVIKGKRTVTSLHDAVDTELARVTIEANSIADRIQINMNSLRELAANHVLLFADTAQIVLKANDDLVALITLRIDAHTKAEADRLEKERETIRAEEEAKAKAAADKQIADERAAEQKRIDEERASAQPATVEAQVAQTPAGPATRSAATISAPTRSGTYGTSRYGTERLRALIDAGLADMTPGELQQSLDAIRQIRTARVQRVSA